MKVQIVHLVGPGFSGRGVKLRKLSPTEKDDVYHAAAVQAGDDGKRFMFIRAREGVTKMLLGVTEPGLKTLDEVKAAKWTPLSVADLQTPDGPYYYDTLFSSKEDEILCAKFRREHEVTQGEIDTILGKAIEAQED
jgi:hypothetical protein